MPRLKDLGRWYSGGTPPRDEEAHWRGEVPWISAKDINGTAMREPTAFVTAKAARTYSRIVPPKSILLVARGMALVHGVPVALTEREVCFNQDLRALVPRSAFNPRFLYFGLLGARRRLHAHIDRAAHGTARVIDSAYRERLYAPPLDKQEEIVDFLDRECERLARVTRRCEALQSKLDEALFSVVSERLASHGAPTVPLRRVVTSISDGPFGSSLASRHYTDQPGARVVRLGNIGRAEFLDLDRVYVSEDYFIRELSSHALHAGDVVVAGLGEETHPLGRACVVPTDLGPALNKADCYRLTVDRSRIDAWFLAWVLSYGPAVEAATVMSRGSTRARLNTQVARDLPLPLPALSDQRELTRSFESERRSARRIVSQLGEVTWRLTEYRDALITEAVTGQLDIAQVSESQLDEKAHAGLEGQPIA